ncbi:MAG: MMPL family transporter, partial [Psychrosphaera sp.]|nr:MMPL family transporter [Psychrosphaera sp.]
MNEKFFGFIHKHPVWTILFSLLLAFAAAGGAQKLSFKSDYRIFFSEDDPQLVAYESMQKIYNKSDNVSFIVVPENGDVFTAKHLAALKELTKQSWQVPYSTRVDSLTNFQHTYAVEDDMIVGDLVSQPQGLGAADLARIKQIALNEPLLLNKTISQKGHLSVVNVAVNLPGIDPGAEIPEVAAFVRNIKDQFLAKNPGTQVHLSGMVMLNNAFAEAAMDDGATLIPMMFLTVVVIMGLLLRTISGTVATVIIIFLSIGASMGLAGWLGFFLTGPSASAPTIILTLAVADCIHILSTMFYEMRHGAS